MKNEKAKTKAMTMAVCTLFLVVLSVAFAMAPAVASEEDTKVGQGIDDGKASRTGTSPESREMLAVGKTTITIDGNPGDWAGISPVVVDSYTDGGGGAYEIRDVYATSDSSNLYLRMDLGSIGTTAIYFELDVDENINTGYNTNTDIWGWYLNPHDTGIDYWVWVVVDDGTADLCALDSSGSDTYIGSCPVGIGSVVEVAVPLSAIGESASPSLNMDFQTFYYGGPQDEAPNTGNVHYPAEAEGPTVSIYTDSSAYDMGDVMHLGLDVTNPGDAQDVRFAIWLEMPGGGIHVLTYMSTPITLPAGFPYSNENFAVIPLPSIPEGRYTWNAALIEPSGPIEFIDHDTAPWTFGAVAGKWAVIVGEADYVGTVNDLDYTDDDARDMYDALISGGWEADHIQLLIDANRATIEGAIDWLATNAGPGDTALFFFSGHGTYSTDVYPFDETDGYDEYICPTDGDNIRDDELDAKLDTIDSDVAIAVIIDSCFAGGMGKSADLKAKTLPKPKVELETGDGFAKDCGEPGRVVLMACDEDEYSYESSSVQNGFFTYFLVNGLSGAADANSNGEVSAEEAFGYTDPLVLSSTGGEQDPQIYDGYTGELGITILLKSVFKLPQATAVDFTVT